jgi:hypothetical protein
MFIVWESYNGLSPFMGVTIPLLKGLLTSFQSLEL